MNPENFPRYTYHDYKNWKENWELICGYPMQIQPSKTLKHCKIHSRLIAQSSNSIGKNQDCEYIVFNKLDWKINDDTVVRPDIMIVCGDPTSDFLEMPPVLIIEICFINLFVFIVN